MYISSYPPRECGIATFCKDLTDAMDKRFNPRLSSEILAMNDAGGSIYNYGKKVIMQLSEDNIENYMDLAKEINESEDIKLISVQHEFGIFGGDKGEFLIPFLENITKPVAITFHSILPDPDEKRLRIVQAVCKRCEAVVVMAETGKEILIENYKVEGDKIHVIHHGVPSVEFLEDNSELKKSLNLENRKVVSTFGLINRGKGMEYVIKALPKLVKKHPELLYLIIGETHPNVRKEEGESYRKELIELVKELGLKDNVKFYNKYLTLDEIITYLKASDIYVYSALEMNQIVSGTLAYALSAGKAVVATPSLYAKEILNSERGLVVELKNIESMEGALGKILDDDNLKKKLEKNAYEFSRQMLWENVSKRYLEVFKGIQSIDKSIGEVKLPEVKLEHLKTLTDDTGIIQHAKHALPNRLSGYCVDDNARGLIVAAKFGDVRLMSLYLGFLHYAQKENGEFKDFMSYEKKFLESKSSEDSFGRALWSLGVLINSKVGENLKSSAKFVFDNALGKVLDLRSPRAWAFGVLGLYNYYQVFEKEDILDKIKILGNRLLEGYGNFSGDDWKWFEGNITYCNGRLPEALFLVYELSKDKKYLDVAKESLGFLSSLVFLEDKLVLIGQNGWYSRKGERAYYDQQPVDAASMVGVYMTGYRITSNKEYYDKAFLAYSWFLGNNSLNQSLYDEGSGGCYDGLLPECVNLNQGAESTISHLLARLELEGSR